MDKCNIHFMVAEVAIMGRLLQGVENIIWPLNIKLYGRSMCVEFLLNHGLETARISGV